MNAGVQDAGTVPVRVQVIDLQPFALDLVLPTYLPAKDLTQRVARDAGLGAYWEDGTRRIFWLRARGRVMAENERLEDLGVVPYELLHLLPQPPDGSGVQERPPEYPPNKGYAAAGNLNMVFGLVVVALFTIGWVIGLSAQQGVVMGMFPSIGLALLCTSFARHMLGGEGSSWKIPLVGLLVWTPLFLLTALATVGLSGAEGRILAATFLPALVAGLGGVVLGWLAWYGAVEPLPKVTMAQVLKQEQEAVYQCGICGLPVTPDVRSDCEFVCGRVFHVGCHSARKSVAREEGVCAVCGYNPRVAPAQNALG